MDLELLKLSSSATVLDAASKIDKNHLRCVFIAEDEKIIGVCSQGDIIRMLLQGGNEYTPVDKITKTSFVYLHEKNFKRAFGLIKQHGITVIPILDENFHLRDVITLPMILERTHITTDGA